MQTFDNILRDLNIEFHGQEHRHGRPGWFQMDCPFCGRDSGKFHMGYSVHGNFVNCWRCGSHRLDTTIMEITGLPYNQIAKLLQTVKTPFRTIEPKRVGTYKPPKNVRRMSDSHKIYLKNRGFKWKKIERLWQVKAFGKDGGRLSWRLFIPITHRGAIVSWTSRSIGAAKPKYISSESATETISHKHLLYGMDYARDCIVICEGPIDVWAIGPGAVATLGMDYSTTQFEQMLSFKNRTICFDSEPAAQERAMKLLDELAPFPGKTINVQLESGKDAAEAHADEIKALQKKYLSKSLSSPSKSVKRKKARKPKKTKNIAQNEPQEIESANKGTGSTPPEKNSD